MRYRFIRDHVEEYPVTRLCHALGMSRSGYYVWCRHPESARAQEDWRLLQQITTLHTASKKTYGSPRIYASLRQLGETCGRHRITRLMRRHGIAAKHRRKFRATTDSRHDLPVAENVLDRQFTPAALNLVWVSDITYVPTGEGWLYLATVMDLASRRIVGWAMSSRIDRRLVSEALTAALKRRRPAPGLIHHSDRGSQYASRDYQLLLTHHGLIPSMSRKGNCWDNAPTERFFRSLKHEQLNYERFRTKEAAKLSIIDYLAFYNGKRTHSKLGYQTPLDFERDFYRKAA